MLFGDLSCSLLDLYYAFSGKQWVGMYFLEKLIGQCYTNLRVAVKV